MEKHLTKILITVSFLLAALIVFFPVRSKTPPSPVSPVVKAEEPKQTVVISPDGKVSLKMREEKGENEIIYTFSSANINFTKNVPLGSTMSIPLNTFSPDNKYVFVKETGPFGDKYYVFLDNQLVEISSLFYAKHPEYKITDMTGWGGVNLIVFNTDKIEGGTGPSFWFEIPSKSFIQLSNRFN
jgi:hypothetical protein